MCALESVVHSGVLGKCINQDVVVLIIALAGCEQTIDDDGSATITQEDGQLAASL